MLHFICDLISKTLMLSRMIRDVHSRHGIILSHSYVWKFMGNKCWTPEKKICPIRDHPSIRSLLLNLFPISSEISLHQESPLFSGKNYVVTEVVSVQYNDLSFQVKVIYLSGWSQCNRMTSHFRSKLYIYRGGLGAIEWPPFSGQSYCLSGWSQCNRLTSLLRSKLFVYQGGLDQCNGMSKFRCRCSGIW